MIDLIFEKLNRQFDSLIERDEFSEFANDFREPLKKIYISGATDMLSELAWAKEILKTTKRNENS